jgi:hypothetical protein
MASGLPRLTFWFAIWITLGVCSATAQSTSGRLTGKVVDVDGNPVAGAVVVATNQSTIDTETSRSKADGNYSMRLRAGAYRITVQPPFEARFDRGKAQEYGVFTNILCDAARICRTLENVIIDGGDRRIDFVVAEPAKAVADPAAPDTPVTQARGP